MRVSPNKNRLVQVRRTGGRKLFDAARRELFLSWFAATCNVTLSAAKADVCCQTVFRHRMKDPVFAADWDAALQQGYARLEARLLEHSFGQSGTSAEDPLHHPSDGPPPPADQVGRGEDLEIRRDLEAEAEKHFDPQLALQLLREHARRAGAGGRQKNQRTPARAAGNKEIAEALAKRLKGFALRHSSGQALRHSSGQALRVSKDCKKS